jgi:polysaccharide export outer membrane protein
VKTRTIVATFVTAIAVAFAVSPASAQTAGTTGARPSPAVSDGDTKPKPAAPSTGEEYRLGSGDKIRIEVYKDPQLSQSAQVRPDGKITLPLVGDIDAAGRTPAELRQGITTSLKEYMTNPVVTVIVVEASASTAFVVGEVAHSGSVNLQGQMTVLQAIAVAGGLKDFANTKNIHILRKGPSGTQTIAFNYKEALKGNGSQIYLRPGDTVVVPD